MFIPAALIPFDTIRHSGDWARWARLTAEASPFLSPEFFALNRPLAHEGTAIVAEAWTPSGIVGALPLVLDATILRALRSDHSPSFDFSGTPAGLEAIWGCLKDDDRWSELVLDKVPAESLLVTRLPELARRDGYPVVMHADSRHRFFELTGFEAAMDSKFRSNLLRCERKAGSVVLERVTVPTRDDFEEALAIEAKAWKGANGTSIDADPRVSHIYEALGRLLGPRGRAALYFLRAAGKRIATLFAIEDQHTLFALKIGFDPTAAQVSPGHLMILEVARDAEQRGLRELNFVGRDAEWKQKWTDRVHELVALRIYARTPRGLVRYGLRELVKPLLPEPIRSTPRSPLPRRCQRADIVGGHTLPAHIAGRLDRGLGIKTRIKKLFAKPPAPAARLGAASEFPVGSWVRVRERAEIEAMLDSKQRTRGLVYVPVQWEECGKLYRVERHVQRLRDDRGKFRPVSRTVLLEGSDCAGHGTEPAGCGRHCPLMYRDEWLVAAQAPAHVPHPAAGVRHARVRDVDDIVAGLDAFGRRDGLTFMPEMAVHAGKRFVIASQLGDVFEYDRWIKPAANIFILAGLHCTGALTAANGPCERACALMWHEDWLLVEPETMVPETDSAKWARFRSSPCRPSGARREPEPDFAHGVRRSDVRESLARPAPRRAPPAQDEPLTSGARVLRAGPACPPRRSRTTTTRMPKRPHRPSRSHVSISWRRLAFSARARGRPITPPRPSCAPATSAWC